MFSLFVALISLFLSVPLQAVDKNASTGSSAAAAATPHAAISSAEVKTRASTPAGTPVVSPLKILETALLNAVAAGESEHVKKQLDQHPELLEVVGEDRENLLMQALWRADAAYSGGSGAMKTQNIRQAVMEIARRTKNINHQDIYGQTALFIAATMDDQSYVEPLLQLDASANVIDKEGESPFLTALEHFHVDAAELLFSETDRPLAVLFRGSPELFHVPFLKKIAQQTVAEIEAKKLKTADIPVRWRKKLMAAQHARLQKLFEQMEKEEKNRSALPHPVNNRVLFIVLDETEKSAKEALSISLWQMIDEVAAPIMASAHALNNASKMLVNTPKYIEQQWDIKKIDDHGRLVLLVPKEKAGSPVKPHAGGGHDLSPRELSLGLKVDHLPAITLDGVKKFAENKEADKADFLSALNRVFVTRKEYAGLGKLYLMRRWTIYLTGHGDEEDLVAGLSFDEFKDFLKYMSQHIVTKLFAYVTCYAVGSNMGEIFDEVQEELSGDAYPFTIVTQGKTDTITQSPAFFSVSRVRYKDAVSLITQSETPDLTQLLPALFGELAPEEPAFVRFAYRSWFVPYDVVLKSFSIGETMALARTAPLTLAASKYPLLLLYASYVPFPVNIIPDNRGKYPKFLSMVPGTGFYTFNYIDIGQHDLVGFIEHLKRQRTEQKLVFFIHNLVSHQLQQAVFGYQALQGVIVDFSGGAGQPTRVYVTTPDQAYQLDGRVLTPVASYLPYYEHKFKELMDETYQEAMAKLNERLTEKRALEAVISRKRNAERDVKKQQAVPSNK